MAKLTPGKDLQALADVFRRLPLGADLPLFALLGSSSLRFLAAGSAVGSWEY